MKRRQSEKSILNESLVALSADPDNLVWRNNSGMAWQGRQRTARVGQTVTVEPGMVILTEGRPIKFGLPGSPDIIGIARRRPVAVEIKDEIGVQSEVQINFERVWTRVGGVYVLARSADEALERITSATLIG